MMDKDNPKWPTKKYFSLILYKSSLSRDERMFLRN